MFIYVLFICCLHLGYSLRNLYLSTLIRFCFSFLKIDNDCYSLSGQHDLIAYIGQADALDRNRGAVIFKGFRVSLCGRVNVVQCVRVSYVTWHQTNTGDGEKSEPATWTD